MRTLRQQDLCVASSPVAPQPCDNAKAELRWYHKSSDSALVGFSPTPLHRKTAPFFSFILFLTSVPCFVFKAEHLIADFVSHHMCLEAEPRGDRLRLKPCKQSDSSQKWQFTHYRAQG